VLQVPVVSRLAIGGGGGCHVRKAKLSRLTLAPERR
jgi:hypothetical protein